MLGPQWVFVSAALGLVGSLRYAYATLRGDAWPNRVSFFLWGMAPLIAFSAQLGSGVGAPAIPTLAAGLGPLVVLTASMASRHGRVRVTRFDLACGAISVVALLTITSWAVQEWVFAAYILALAAILTGTIATRRRTLDTTKVGT